MNKTVCLTQKQKEDTLGRKEDYGGGQTRAGGKAKASKAQWYTCIHMLTKKVKYEGTIHLIFVFDGDV